MPGGIPGGELKRFQEKEWVQFLIRDVKLIMEEYLQQMDQAIAICQEPDVRPLICLFCSRSGR